MDIPGRPLCKVWADLKLSAWLGCMAGVSQGTDSLPPSVGIFRGSTNRQGPPSFVLAGPSCQHSKSVLTKGNRLALASSCCCDSLGNSASGDPGLPKEKM